MHTTTSPTEQAIKKEQSIADAVLERLEIIDPTCILAGGAPRDWWLGTTANDLDFYLYYRGTTAEYIKALNSLGFGNVKVLERQGMNAKARSDELYGTMAGLTSVHEATYRGKSIQIMRMNAPTFRGVVDQFAVSLSKVWYKKGTIYPEGQARRSRETRNIFVDKGYTPHSTYIQKMMKRFGDNYSFEFRIVNEPHMHYSRHIVRRDFF